MFIVHSRVCIAQAISALIAAWAPKLVVRGIASAINSEEIDAMAADEADLLLVDLETWITTSEATISSMHERQKPARVAVLADTYGASSALPGLQQGVDGYLDLCMDGRELVSGLCLIAASHVVVSANARSCLDTPDDGSLTRIEQDILRHVADGLDIDLIAQRVYASASTVKRRLHTIEAKLGTQNRVQAAVKAVRHGLI